MDLKEYINVKREAVDSFFQTYFKEQRKPAVLRESMLYSLFAGGKGSDPFLPWRLTRPVEGIRLK